MTEQIISSTSSLSPSGDITIPILAIYAVMAAPRVNLRMEKLTVQRMSDGSASVRIGDTTK